MKRTRTAFLRILLALLIIFGSEIYSNCERLCYFNREILNLCFSWLLKDVCFVSLCSFVAKGLCTLGCCANHRLNVVVATLSHFWCNIKKMHPTSDVISEVGCFFFVSNWAWKIGYAVADVDIGNPFKRNRPVIVQKTAKKTIAPTLTVF